MADPRETQEISLALQQSRSECRAARFENKQLAASNAYLQKKIIKLMRQEVTIRHQAFHDSLTGLANCNLLLDRFHQARYLAIRHDQSLALLMLDMDKFKSINDTLGHATGDKLLKAVAQRLNAVMRASDTVCRYGGDEFLILLSEMEERIDTDVVKIKIREIMEAAFHIDAKEIYITASIGSAIYPADGKTYDELFRKADRAMFCSKRSVRNSSITEQVRSNHLRLVE